LNARALVIDTNWVLDLWVFDDPRAAPLRQALERNQVCWLACAHMRNELERVLAYPNVHQRLAMHQRDAAQVLAQFDHHAQLCAPPPPCPVRCKDHDDQVFIDLAAQHQADLLSKDKLVLRLQRALRPHGVAVLREWREPIFIT
jgi:putative PIN family toxin of toxin-antitoxin system